MTILEIELVVKATTLKKLLKKARARLFHFVGDVFKGVNIQSRVTFIEQVKLTTWRITFAIEEASAPKTEPEKKEQLHLKYLVQGLKKK